MTLPPATTALPVQTADADTALTALLEFGAKIKRNEQGEVVGVNLFDTKITDAGLVHLKRLTRLQVITPPPHRTIPTNSNPSRTRITSPQARTVPSLPIPAPAFNSPAVTARSEPRVPPLASGVIPVIT